MALAQENRYFQALGLLSIPAQQGAMGFFFSMAMTSELRDGCTTLFWKDRWLRGHHIIELAPHLSALVPPKIINKRTMAEALSDSDGPGPAWCALRFDYL
jgi:hypothetical protein